MAALNTLGFEMRGELMAGGMEGPGDAGGRSDLLEDARVLGARLVQ